MPTLEERETIIHIPKVGEASIYSTEPAFWRLAMRLAGWRLHLEDAGGREYVGPAESLSVRRKRLVAKDSAAAEAFKLRMARMREQRAGKVRQANETEQP